MQELRFLDRDAMIAFLGSKYGLGILREAADAFYQPYLPRQKVLVKAYRDGLIEVYGSEHVDAQIVLLGRSVTFPGHEIWQDQLVDAALGPAYAEYHCANGKIASALVGKERTLEHEAYVEEEASTAGSSLSVAG